MSVVDTTGWISLGRTSNAEIFEVEPTLLAIVPDDKCRDDEATARESIEFQRRHWQARGRRGAVVVFMDAIIEQDAGARGVYANETHGHPTTCFALVGETFFGFAVSQVFTGLAKPPVPTTVFRSLADARPWIEEQNRERGGTL